MQNLDLLHQLDAAHRKRLSPVVSSGSACVLSNTQPPSKFEQLANWQFGSKLGGRYSRISVLFI
jgi:hypothetical protein